MSEHRHYALQKFFLILLAAVIIIGALFRISHPLRGPGTEPVYTPTYDEVVPRGFSAVGEPRPVDPRDTAVFLDPKLPLVKISDQIVELSCEGYDRECQMRALYDWVLANIEHTEVLPTREHVIGPAETILYRQRDDTTGSLLLAALYRAQGISARIGITPYSTFVETNLRGEPIRIDLGCPRCSFGTARYAGDNESIEWVS